MSTDKPFNTRATLGTSASTLRTRREQESQEDREARLDRQCLRTNHITPGQRWVPQLAIDTLSVLQVLLSVRVMFEK